MIISHAQDSSRGIIYKIKFPFMRCSLAAWFTLLINVHVWWPSYTNTKTYFELVDMQSIEARYCGEVKSNSLSNYDISLCSSEI